jgi:hypothetical protein
VSSFDAAHTYNANLIDAATFETMKELFGLEMSLCMRRKVSPTSMHIVSTDFRANFSRYSILFERPASMSTAMPSGSSCGSGLYRASYTRNRALDAAETRKN